MTVRGEGRAPRRRLTPRQRRLVREYVRDLNAQQAALRAGYAWGSARHNAAHWLKRNPLLRAAAERALAAFERRRGVGPRALEARARVAFADIRRVVDWGPEGLRPRR